VQSPMAAFLPHCCLDFQLVALIKIGKISCCAMEGRCATLSDTHAYMTQQHQLHVHQHRGILKAKPQIFAAVPVLC